MKSAREWAETLWESLPASAQLALDLNYRCRTSSPNRLCVGKNRWIRDVELMFKEHASDQRVVCLTALDDFAEEYVFPAAVEAVANAPAPGQS